ncbi:MAG: hypothetical protein ACREMM_08105 [Gemmatimonadales bacterium]
MFANEQHDSGARARELRAPPPSTLATLDRLPSLDGATRLPVNRHDIEPPLADAPVESGATRRRHPLVALGVMIRRPGFHRARALRAWRGTM